MEISKDERELYDRQIRLWGLQGQSRLRNAQILVLGFEAVAVEVVKNLCLAGVGTIVLQSSKKSKESDLAYNFFLSPTDIGENVVEASANAVQRLNPRVSVTTNTSPLSELSAEYIAGHDVVIVTQNTDRDELIRIDDAARTNDCAFFYSTLSGWGGLLFEDLGEKPHQFVAEREILDGASSTTTLGQISSTREIIDVKLPDRKAGSNTEKVTVKQSNVSLKDALSVSQEFGQSMKVRHRAKVSPYLPAFLVLLDGSSLTEESIRNKAEQLGLPASIVVPGFAQQVIDGKDAQLSSLAAILGGTLSQEVINFLTLREYPIQNTHIYDGLLGKGPLYFLSR